MTRKGMVYKGLGVEPQARELRWSAGTTCFLTRDGVQAFQMPLSRIDSAKIAFKGPRKRPGGKFLSLEFDRESPFPSRSSMNGLGEERPTPFSENQILNVDSATLSTFADLRDQMLQLNVYVAALGTIKWKGGNDVEKDKICASVLSREERSIDCVTLLQDDPTVSRVTLQPLLSSAFCPLAFVPSDPQRKRQPFPENLLTNGGQFVINEIPVEALLHAVPQARITELPLSHSQQQDEDHDSTSNSEPSAPSTNRSSLNPILVL
ncbi:hypothetical protein BV22DRAFT_1050210 [Leucogyrophana mollusca]|uniref:Uncharacterized protein n=1 Tax=Leucogyrophana mollusca TaxID=85980 RepID=A0ACB8B522_9AGAM|nr:hypothetical protein BV22DRAFT_1050210 [Leucogyrophana mollusca]